MILFLISDCIIIGLSIALLCYSKKIEKRTVVNGNNELKDTLKDELKSVPTTIETIKVFVSKPTDYFSNNVTISTFNIYSKEKVAEYFTQKLIEDNLIKINNRGDFYEATITFVKE